MSSLRVVVLAILMATIASTAEPAYAGTTGALAGHVRGADGLPLAGARVTVTSPVYSSVTVTDSSGGYTFASLIPAAYDVTVTKDGHRTFAAYGVRLFADLYQVVDLVEPASDQLANVTVSRAKLETALDVDSLTSEDARDFTPLGGGGSLTQAYGAIASQPGVVVRAGQTGWLQHVSARGGAFDQVGYEFDGVPVLRPFDNYPTTTLTMLGQEETQIYAGGPPVDSQTEGLAGYVNQVAKTGSFPGFSSMDIAVGSPALYNGAQLEVGGATPNRSFSYYLAFGSSAQGLRWFDAQNGSGLQTTWGAPFARLACPGGSNGMNFTSCYAGDIGPGGYALGPPVDAFAVAQVWDHENLVNLHLAIPHKTDSGSDDLQLLYDASYLHNTFYGSANDWTLPSNKLFEQLNGDSAYHYLSGFGLGFQYLGPVGQLLDLSSPSQIAELTRLVDSVYYAYNPASIRPNVFLPPIPTGLRDGTANPNSIIKLQYQHDIGAGEYVRVYAFDDWSASPRTCPDSAWSNFVVNCSFNQYVESHANGLGARFVDQLGDKNLVSIDASDSWYTEYEADDETMLNELFGLNPNLRSDSFLYAVDSKHPTNGVCYTNAGSPVSCFSANAEQVGLCQASTSSNSCFFGPGGPIPNLPSSCNGDPCGWFVAENGRLGGASSTKPTFDRIALRDQWKPSDDLYVDIGARYSRYFYQLADTGGAARDFWFNAWNKSYCVVPGKGQVPFYNFLDDFGSNSPCPALGGIQSVPAMMTNQPNDTETFSDVEPEVGATYTVGAHDVVRFSYSRYDQAPNTSLEQPNTLQQDLPFADAHEFWAAGFTTTTHRISAPTVDDVDLSWEHDLKAGTAVELRPFVRRSHDQIENFVLDQRTGFVSGLNAGDQTSEGVELRFTKTWSAAVGWLLSITASHDSVRFDQLAGGGSALGTIDLAIQQYNSFTKACQQASPSSSPTALCGTFGNANAVATEPNGVANPYFNAPAQPLFDLGGTYVPFDVVPGAVGMGPASFETPLAATLALSLRPPSMPRLRVVPEFQFFGGGYYGDPLSGWGVFPSACSALVGSVSGDPRYPYGGVGAPYDAESCFGRIAVPDPYTHRFDDIGAFKAPNQLLMHARISDDFSERITLALDLENIVDDCWGGSAEPWTTGASSHTCGYVAPGYGTLPYGGAAPKSAGGFFNPGSTFQPIVEFPYQQNRSAIPFGAYLELQVKL